MTKPTFPSADDNPYASPRDTIGPAPLDSGPPTGVAVTARLVFTGDHLVESLARFRAQSNGRIVWLVGRFFAIAIIGLFVALAVWQQEYWGAGLVGIVLALLLFGQRFNDGQTRRGFASSPHCNEELTFHLDDAEFRVTSDAQDTRMKWSLFTKAVRFKDGILIFQGPVVFHWVPFSALAEGCRPEDLEVLVRAKVTPFEVH